MRTIYAHRIDNRGCNAYTIADRICYWLTNANEIAQLDDVRDLDDIHDALRKHYNTSLQVPEEGLLVTKYNSFKPIGDDAKSVNATRADHILLRAVPDLLPWAQLSSLVSFFQEGKTYELAGITVLELADNRWIDTEVYAPRLRATSRRCFVPASAIQQRILTYKDTRRDSDGAFWVNWFVVWGPLKYPIEHRDLVHQKHFC